MSAGGSWDAMVSAELAAAGGVEPIRCHDCGVPFAGDRAAARAARWEPYSTRSQQLLDAGPMICPDCVAALLDGLDSALRAAARAGRI